MQSNKINPKHLNFFSNFFDKVNFLILIKKKNNYFDQLRLRLLVLFHNIILKEFDISYIFYPILQTHGIHFLKHKKIKKGFSREYNINKS